MSREKITEMLTLSFGEKLLDHFTILSYDETKKALYHVSDNPRIKEFTPRFSTRLYTGETKAIMRTSTSPTVLQCHKGLGWIIAYDEKRGPLEQFVYEMEWDWSVKATKKEVPDINYTDEHWLLAFDMDHRVYKGEIISTFFMMKDTTVYHKTGQSFFTTYLFKVIKPMLLAETIELKPGYYEVEYQMEEPFLKWKPILDKNLFILPITKAEYTLRRKRLTEKSAMMW